MSDIEWTICQDDLNEDKRSVEVCIDNINYKLTHDTAAITQCLMILNDRIKEVEEKIDGLSTEIYKYRQDNYDPEKHGLKIWT
jgi:hypothetical protein